MPEPVPSHSSDRAPFVWRCRSCGLESHLYWLFHPARNALGNRTDYYCQPCWKQREKSVLQHALVLCLPVALAGLVMVWLWPGLFIGWLMLNLCLLYVLLEATTILHELGHAVAAWLLGCRVYGITLGHGAVVFERRFGDFTFTVHAIAGGGATYVAYPSIHFLRSRRWLVYLAGPLVNAAILVSSLFWLTPGKHDFTHELVPAAALLVANLLALMSSFFPQKLADQYSEGMSDGTALLTVPLATPGQARSWHAGYFACEASECSKNKDHEGAVRWCREGLQLYPDDPMLLLSLGLAHFQSKAFAEARQTWLGLLQRPDVERELRALILPMIAAADLLMDSASPEEAALLLGEAERFSQEAMGRLPGVPAVWVTRGSVLVEQGLVAEGLALLHQALKRLEDGDDKPCCAAYIALGLAKQGRRSESRTYLEAARLLDPDSVVLQVVERKLGRIGFG